MKSVVKRMILFLGLSLAVLAGCGKQTKESGVSKDYIYRYEELPFSAKLPEASGLVAAGDTIYAYGTVWDENYENSGQIICKLDEKGEILEQSRINLPSGTYYNSMAGNEEGLLFSIKSVYQETETGSSEQYYLIQLTASGEEAWSVCLNDIPQLNDQEYFYASEVICLPDGRLLINAMGKRALFDSAGNYQGLLELTGPGAEDMQETPGTMLTLTDGRLFNYRQGEKGLTFQEINLATGVLGEAILVEGGKSYACSPYRGVGYDIMLVDYSNVYGYNLGQEPVKLMNFVDSDLDISGIGSFLAFSPTSFWGSIYDGMQDKSLIGCFTKVEPKDVADKIAITLGGNNIDWDVKRQIVAFNKSNEKYRIHLMDYGELYNTTEDFQAGKVRLNADVASGKAPDILMVSYGIPAKSYMAKGLLADLDPLIKQDEELSQIKILPNVRTAYSMNGHLYQLPPYFYVNTVCGKTAEVGSKLGWTIEEATALLASKPADTMLFEEMLRDQVIANSMSMGGEQFIDWEKGECYYNGEGFIHLLEFAKTFPKEWDETENDENYWRKREFAVRDGKVLAQAATFDSFRGYNRFLKGVFGEEMTPIGFPVEKGIGSSLGVPYSLAISAKSKKQEGAWEFVRYFLTDAFQSKLEYGFPIRVDMFDKLGEESMKKQVYEDENGKPIEMVDYYYIGEGEITIDPITAAELEKAKEFIYQVETSEEYNEDLYNIIAEEAAAFFEGQKSVKEVADIIQSRAQIYVNENS